MAQQELSVVLDRRREEIAGAWLVIFASGTARFMEDMETLTGRPLTPSVSIPRGLRVRGCPPVLESRVAHKNP